MSVSFNQGYRENIDSFKMNEKIDRIYGANGVIKGFDLKIDGKKITVVNLDEVTKEKIDEGEAIVNGTLVKYFLKDGEAPMFVENLQDGKWYVYGLYSVYEKTFRVKLASTIEEAQGTWKVFLGHVVVSGGAISEIQGLVPTSDITKDVIYRRLTSLAILARYVYDANSAVIDDVWKKVIEYVGNKIYLKTVNKNTIVEAINEIKINVDNIINQVGDELDIKNLARKELTVGNNAINCFQMKQYTSNGSIVGYIMIKLPIQTFNNQVISLNIKGTAAASSKGFNLIVTGTLNGADSRWQNCSAYVLGDMPFTGVTFARNSNDGIYILLGKDNLDWGKVNIALESVLVSNVPDGTKENIWRDGWNIKPVTSVPSASSSTSVSIKTGGPQEGEFVDPDRRIEAGDGLLGGGNLRNDVKLSAKFGTGYNDVARGNHTHGDSLPSKFDGKTYRVLITDGSGNVVTSETITTAELEALDNIKSNIQQQLDSKSGNGHTHPYLPLAGGTVTGNLSVNGATKVQDFYIAGKPVIVSKTYPTSPANGTILFKVNS